MRRRHGKGHGKGRRLPLFDRVGVQAMFDHEKPSKDGRSCGDCRACCTTLRVRLDGPDGPNTVEKPMGEPCQHLRKKKPGRKGGCGIYDKHPTDCAVYKCYWLEGFGEKRDRPDRLGLILDTSDGIIGGIYALSGIKTIAAWEVRPGASRANPRFHAAIVGMVRRGLAVLYRGTGKGLEPVMVQSAKRKLLDTTMRALGIGADLAGAHFEDDGHPEAVAGCPVCDGVCPAHYEGGPSPICSVCALVADGSLEKAVRST